MIPDKRAAYGRALVFTVYVVWNTILHQSYVQTLPLHALLYA